MRRLCVFCGSRSGENPAYAEAARALGHELARRGIGLVYGAGNIGLMGILADAALAFGGEVIGVIPRALVHKEVAHERLTQIHIVDTMHQRKALMAELADGFVALPGGFGTADELFEILTWAQLGLHAKPIGVLNWAGFFDAMLAWLEHAVHEGFLKPRHQSLLLVARQASDLLHEMDRFSPMAAEDKWIEEKDL